MKADFSALDWAEPEEPPPSEAPALGKRYAGRVPVNLRIAIATKDCAYLAESVDISETGVLIRNYDGPKLRKGKKVMAIIKGIISDDDSDDGLITMYVARVARPHIGLTFNRNQASH